MPTSLDDIVAAWARWSSDQKGGGGVWISASTRYNQHEKELGQYRDEYEVKASYTGIDYDPHAPSPTPGTSVAAIQDFNNNTSEEQSPTWVHEKTTTSGFKLTKSKALSLGVEVTAEVAFPEVAKVTEKVSISTTLTSSKEDTTTDQQVWKVNELVKVKPYRGTLAKLVVTTHAYNINYRANVLLRGYVAVWYMQEVEGHRLFFHTIESVFGDCEEHKLVDDLDDYEIVDDGVQTTAAGTFSGGQGNQLDAGVHRA
jgi:hypothetical protein